MSEGYPLTFSDVDQKMYEKLDTAARDLYDRSAKSETGERESITKTRLASVSHTSLRSCFC